MADELTFLLYAFIIISMTWISKWAFKSKYRANRGVYKLIMVVFPAYIAAVRGTTGTDSQMYMRSFYNLKSVFESRTNGFEIGYSFIVNTMNSMGLRHELFFFLMNAVMILCFVMFIENEKENIDVRFSTFLFFIYYYLLSFNATRQATAMFIGLYAYSQYSKKKYLKFAVLVVLASTIHISGWMAFAMVLCDIVTRNVQLIRKYKKQLFFIGIVCAVFLIFNRNILGGIVASLTNEAYAQYILADIGKKSNPLYWIMMNLLPLVFVLIGYFNQRNSGKYENYYLLTIGGYILSLLSLVTGTQGDRIGLNFRCLELMTLSNCIVSQTFIKVGKRRLRITATQKRVLLVVFFVVVYTFSWGYQRNGDVVPYMPFKGGYGWK